ncbi:glycosyltransferase family 25 protein [Halocynthiibacter namhaensis]|uniref:glycosyltransferase family 25 protein n=1 Tax=Halocynthiibacter namhaensis TaxID=1290553 RepID=UPI0005798A14|nr:glycosyltransferase family 25 protein [Halocynthiibacter namhaensis]
MKIINKQLHIFILTLKDASERRSSLIEALEEMNLSYELWFGVDGRNGLPAEYEAVIDRFDAQKKLRRELADAEFACALSHNEIYKSIVDRGITSAIILEDDACIGAGFKKLTHALMSSPCELLLLDHKKARVAWRDVLQINTDLKAYRVVLPPELTTGYYITQAGAVKMLAATGKISGVADWPCDISTLDCRALMPRTVTSPPADVAISHIHEQRKNLVASSTSMRFLTPTYWKRWWLKNTYKKLR